MEDNNTNKRLVTETEYIVAERDTVPDIEKKLGLSWAEIQEMNKETVKNSEELRPGTKLRIPGRTGNS